MQFEAGNLRVNSNTEQTGQPEGGKQRCANRVSWSGNPISSLVKSLVKMSHTLTL